MNLNNVNKEWLKEFTAEHKSLYGRTPTNYEILQSWNMNKEYFYSRIK